jgi:hypothetical protein
VGVLVTSLHKNLYGITQPQKKGKMKLLQKEGKIVQMKYIKKKCNQLGIQSHSRNYG